jgi:flagellar biosynthesis protein FlhG
MAIDPAPTPRPDPLASGKGKNIVSIASGKGGVGKTWFAITLTHALAKAGVRALLFDGDLGLANVDIQLGLMPRNDLGGVLSGKLTLNQAAIPYPDGNFDIIAGRSGAGSLANIPASRLQLLSNDLLLLAPLYDRVIIDLGAGVERTVRQFTHHGGVSIVVTVTHMEHPGADLRIVINTANSVREGERTYNTLLKACEGFLKISPPLLGVIRRDTKVREAIRAQTPLMIRSPTCEAASDVESIAEKLRR